MLKHEQAVIDSFNVFFKHRAMALGRNVRSFSLDGQDVLVGADYLLSDHSRFALIEFKFSQSEIADEEKKQRRLRLCRELESNREMRVLHDQCHFIAWAEMPELQGRCNVYRHEVCNRLVFGTDCGLQASSPQDDARTYASEFAGQFFGGTPSRSLGLDEFELYLAWVLRTPSESTRQSLELLTYDEHSNDCAMVVLPSVRAAYDWMQQQRLSPSPSWPSP